MNASAIVACHATCVLAGNAGVLIRGRSGSGKSMLAASLIDKGGSLVADDRVRLVPRAGRLIALAPAPIAGLLEIRGIGPVARPHEQVVIVRLVVDLVDPGDAPRLPDREDTIAEIAGIEISRLIVAEPGANGRGMAALNMIGEVLASLAANRTLHLPAVSP